MEPRSTRSLWVRTLLFTAILPATVALVIPALLVRGGLGRIPSSFGVVEAAAAGMATIGLAGYFSCVSVFITTGGGTPAPIDPPRRLVVAGPYRHVRNPMYLSALAVVLASALAFRSPALGGYAVVLGVAFHGFVVGYEEPHLLRAFGQDYGAYLRAVPRWIPRRSAAPADV